MPTLGLGPTGITGGFSRITAVAVVMGMAIRVGVYGE